MPTIIFAILFRSVPESIYPVAKDSFFYLILAIFITTFIIPALSIATLKFTNSIENFSLRERKERIIPFIFIFIFYAMTTYLFIERIKINQVIANVMILTSILILLLTLITTRYKISIHAAGLCSGIGFLVGLTRHYQATHLLEPIAVMIAVTGLVLTSRLYLNAHTPQEVSTGAAFGFFYSLITILIFT